jgi:ribonuclease R
MNRHGKGFLASDDKSICGTRVLIPAFATGTALHGDRVEVEVRGRHPQVSSRATERTFTGIVVRVIERRHSVIVGTLRRRGQHLLVIPDDARFPREILVAHHENMNQSTPGHKVVIRIHPWRSRAERLVGTLVEKLGPPDAQGVDMLCILRQHQLPVEFPPEVQKEARAFGTSVLPVEIKGRTDCRRDPVITIDPDDAKDFDDAFSLERATGDRWLLRVHVADVSHYVRPGTALDAEARRRGNSTYLVDRVIPMLPEALSNELCSLKPHVERLSKCVEFLLTDEGRVLRTRFFPAVIRSRQRFSYEEAFRILRRTPKSDIETMLQNARRLAMAIRERRFEMGALNLEGPQSMVRLDGKGRIAEIERVENDESHQLIEEFMLMANGAVAERLISLNRPTIHRVHEVPAADRLHRFRELVLNHGLACGDLTQRREVRSLLQQLGGHPAGPAFKVAFLKTLRRACYGVQPLGHYGLATRKYTHFTSPIRRYADLTVHRALFEDRAPRESTANGAALCRVAEHLSVTERNSSEAERHSRETKVFAFLQAELEARNTSRYRAIVTGMEEFGLVIDVPDLAISGVLKPGLSNHRAVSTTARQKARGLRFGDCIEVQVSGVNSPGRQVEFRLAEPCFSTGRRAHGRKQASDPSSRGRDRLNARRRPVLAHPVSSASGARNSRRRRAHRGGRASHKSVEMPRPCRLTNVE